MNNAAEAFIGLTVRAENQARATLDGVRTQMGELDDATRRFNNTAAQTATTNQTFTRSFAEADDVIQQMTGSLAGQSGALGEWVAMLGAGGTALGALAVGVGAVGAAAAGASTALGDSYAAIRDGREVIGATADEFVALQTAASDARREFPQVQMAMENLTRFIAEAARDKEKRDFLVGLGIDPAKITSPIDGLNKLRDAIMSIADARERLDVASTAFGNRGAAAMLDVMGTGTLEEALRRADAAGLRWSDDQQATAAKAVDASNSIKRSWEGLHRTAQESFGGIGTVINQSIAGTLDSFRDWLATGKEIEEGLKALNRLGREPAPGTRGTTAMPVMGTVDVAGRPFSEAEKAAKAERERFALWTQNLDTMVRAVELGRLDGDAVLRSLEAQKQREASIERQNALLAAQARIIEDMANRPDAGLPPGYYGPPAPENLPPAPPRFDMLPGGYDEMRRWQDAFRYPAEGLDEKRKLTDFEKRESEALRNIAETFRDSVSDAFLDIMTHTREWKDAMFEAFMDISTAVLKGGLDLALGGILPFQAGGTLMQSGGTLGWVQAQSGIMTRGVRGVDTERVIMGRGESIIDHTTTDTMRRAAEVILSGGGQPAAPSVTIHNIDLSVPGLLRSVDELDHLVPNEIAPRLGRAIQRQLIQPWGY